MAGTPSGFPPVSTRRRGVVLVVTLLIALVSVYVADRAGGARPTRCERFTAASAARADAVTGSGRRVVVIGDSYSAGLGLTDITGSWPTRLPGEVHVAGFSGSGFAAHASRCGRCLVRRPRSGRAARRRRSGRRRGRPQRLRPAAGRGPHGVPAADGRARGAPGRRGRSGRRPVARERRTPGGRAAGVARRAVRRDATFAPHTSSCRTSPTASTSHPPGTPPSATSWLPLYPEPRGGPQPGKQRRLGGHSRANSADSAVPATEPLPAGTVPARSAERVRRRTPPARPRGPRSPARRPACPRRCAPSRRSRPAGGSG